jgi:hypothetical protein
MKKTLIMSAVLAISSLCFVSNSFGAKLPTLDACIDHVAGDPCSYTKTNADGTKKVRNGICQVRGHKHDLICAKFKK